MLYHFYLCLPCHSNKETFGKPMASAKSRTIRAFSPQLWRLSPHLCGTVIPVFLSLIHQSRCQGAINKPRLESKIIVPNGSKRLVLPNTRGHFHPSKCFGCFSHLFLWFFSQCKAMRTGDGANSDIVTSISSPPFAPRLNHFGYMGVSKNRGTPKWMVYNGKPY